jgi:hypothetical protein
LDPCNLAEKGKKEGICGQRRREKEDLQIEQSQKRNLEKRKEHFAALWFKEELGNNIVLHVRSYWKGFRYKLINEAD